jgi:methylated-DNA-[protein]-cysteine S-methyltransferase
MSTSETPLLYARINSPIGELLLVGDGQALYRLHMLDAPRPASISPAWKRDSQAFTIVESQLSEYFAGERTAFDLPLRMIGTPFQRSVWSALQRIDYGQTASYGEIAAEVGQPGAARAVGIANGRNPISIIVPCHRVIGADGSLTGYGGGITRKRYLLDLERAASPTTNLLAWRTRPKKAGGR